MNSSVVTLFDNHFHYGFAGLTNSLYQFGFRGNIYAGYRGQLPAWTKNATPNESIGWPGATTLIVAEGLTVYFLPVETSYHLTNYKPNFMIKLYEGIAKNSESLVYFDSDIVVKCDWSFFEKWMSFGVAVVHEIISNDMCSTHPIRKMWEEIILKDGKKINHQLNSYVNGGFCGVKTKYIEFIYLWKHLMDLGISDYNLAPEKFMPTDRTDPFYATDQDTLNMTLMCTETPISELGPEGMDFIHGGSTMSHALGSPKPWKKNYLYSALIGQPITLADASYWRCVDGPIKPFSSSKIKFKRLCMKVASLIGRFYQKKH
jgi:hypothetical protein